MESPAENSRSGVWRWPIAGPRLKKKNEKKNDSVIHHRCKSCSERDSALGSHLHIVLAASSAVSLPACSQVLFSCPGWPGSGGDGARACRKSLRCERRAEPVPGWVSPLPLTPGSPTGAITVALPQQHARSQRFERELHSPYPPATSTSILIPRIPTLSISFFPCVNRQADANIDDPPTLPFVGP